MDKCPPKPECPPKPDCPKPPEPNWNVIDLHKQHFEKSVTNNVTINHNEQIINRVRVINLCACGGGCGGGCSYGRVEVAPCLPRGCVDPTPGYYRQDYYAPQPRFESGSWQRRMDYDYDYEYDYGSPVRVQPLVWYPDRMRVDVQPMPWYPDRMPMYVQPVTWYPQDDYYGRPRFQARFSAVW